MNLSRSSWQESPLEASINLSYRNAKEAEAIAQAVSPDNVKGPHGLFIKTTVCGSRVSTKILCRKQFGTFISTIDDLLSAVSVAEKSLLAVKKR